MKICMSAMVELDTELQMVDILALLDQERGSIRLVWTRRVHSSR
jgi:hypothetical protein